jgi:mannose-6-phosphate isomerase-like protein (cupin superfamily)|tara:strand:- start:717 stop:1091 length:375 start_codon:yes stop_codon:yes gene_type:complete
MSIEPVFSRLEAHRKGWGDELWITNNEKYCGKILRFNEGSSFSMHYHILKEETWCVTKGSLKIEFFDLERAEKRERTLGEGDVVHLKPCTPHKLTALEDSSVFEVSTQHFDEDSYRIEKGDSQK